jgi:hypothetical protein
MIIKLAANAFMKRALKGALSKESIQIGRSAGLTKPFQVIVDGIHRGNEAQIKKLNIKHFDGDKSWLARKFIGKGSNGRATTILGKPIIATKIGLRSDRSKMLDEFTGRDMIGKTKTVRHEIDEIKEGLKKGNKAIIYHPNSTMIEHHNNLAVLGRERNISRRLELAGRGINIGNDGTTGSFPTQALNEVKYFSSKDLKNLRKLKHNTNLYTEIQRQSSKPEVEAPGFIKSWLEKKPAYRAAEMPDTK